MGSHLIELKKLLNTRRVSEGRVVGSTASTVSLATSRGVVSVPNASGGKYTEGQAVTLRNGSISVARAEPYDIPTFII